MNKSTTEFEIKISEPFVLVEASKLSLDDEFMKYEPKTEREEKFKKDLTEAIKKVLRISGGPSMTRRSMKKERESAL